MVFKIVNKYYFVIQLYIMHSVASVHSNVFKKLFTQFTLLYNVETYWTISKIFLKKALQLIDKIYIVDICNIISMSLKNLCHHLWKSFYHNIKNVPS